MKLGLVILMLAFIFVTIATISLTNGLIYKYVARIKSNSVIYILTRLHFISALIFGFFLPNNYLRNYPQINKYYEENGLWILASFFIIFVISLTFIGIAFNILLILANQKVVNEIAFENQKKAFWNFLKRKFDF